MLVAASAPQHALEVVEVSPVALAVGRSVVHDVLDTLEQVRVDDGLVPADVLFPLVGNDAAVVRVAKHPMDLRD
ncbi:hypothetical protein [Pseudactinotalea sp. HY158]|uniref:hypothetical protein n=1 Tax=Pseudactinotalea sp. HY158 TaxID=2654547 RepID=UPI001E60AE9F|nr:hypothetical protein [Pseudactinotalea sp. HY158]